MKAYYICSYPNCGKSYVNNSILKRHIQALHNEEKKFKCNFCQRGLASRQNLKEHIYTHTGEKPYRCPVTGCNATFRQGTHLSVHRKTEHVQVLEGQTKNVTLKFEIDAKILTKMLADMKENTEIDEINCEVELRQITGPYMCLLPNVFE
ncbi:hypothetical protein SteCoe_5982 [Stentor coeruleus]|uniref:C2H2-type domain-containing protein n=1 Tax=Stentor coeruleus TaxID=5963 RepID=A0A1R2CR87_9CILI|nr:hypothetical protein SteCoe_5982 [Stentor coeruleus]